MSDDKRADAMRRAIAESDAKRSEERSEGGGGPSMMDTVKSVFNTVKDKFVEWWSTTVGKIAICAGGGVLLLLIIISIVTGGSGSSGSNTIQYSLPNAILNVYTDVSSASGYAYDAYVEIHNDSGVSIYAKDVSFTIREKSGSIVMTDHSIAVFPAVIGPGETGYMFNRFGTEVTGITDPGATFELVPTFTLMPSDSSPHEYPTRDFSIKTVGDHRVMTGQVTNDTDSAANAISVFAVFYDSDGRCIGLGTTFMRDMPANSSDYVYFDPVVLVKGWSNKDIADYKVRAY